MTSILELMRLHFDAPDHTTLSRRRKSLKIKLRMPKTRVPIGLIIDCTRLSSVGQGHWAAAKHGLRGHQGWKKLDLGVDQFGNIVIQELTDSNVDDAVTGVKMIKRLNQRITDIVGDRAYDSCANYDAYEEFGTRVVVPPIKNPRVNKNGSKIRNKTVKRIKNVGRHRWKVEAGYHREGKVENGFFRFKTIIGGRLKSRTPETQKTEALLACNTLNRIFDSGRPQSQKIAN